MSECERAQRLSAYHDGEVSEAERVSLEAHLQGCPACAAERNRLRRLSDLLSAGVPILRAMEILASATQNRRLTGVIRSVHEDVAAGGHDHVFELLELHVAQSFRALHVERCDSCRTSYNRQTPRVGAIVSAHDHYGVRVLRKFARFCLSSMS